MPKNKQGENGSDETYCVIDFLQEVIDNFNLKMDVDELSKTIKIENVHNFLRSSKNAKETKIRIVEE